MSLQWRAALRRLQSIETVQIVLIRSLLYITELGFLFVGFFLQN